jgi:hypothetical protein
VGTAVEVGLAVVVPLQRVAAIAGTDAVKKRRRLLRTCGKNGKKDVAAGRYPSATSPASLDPRGRAARARE